MTLKVRKASSSTSIARSTCVLAVGNVAPAALKRAHGSDDVTTRKATLDNLSAELLEEQTPDIVVSMLLDTRCDTAEVAQLLQALDFQGKYFALVETLPVPEMVRREIKMVAPLVDFDVILLADAPPQMH